MQRLGNDQGPSQPSSRNLKPTASFFRFNTPGRACRQALHCNEYARAASLQPIEIMTISHLARGLLTCQQHGLEFVKKDMINCTGAW